MSARERRVGPWRLDHGNAVMPSERGSTLRLSAVLRGPAAEVIEAAAAPVSAFGQRRRMARLTQLATLVERHAD